MGFSSCGAQAEVQQLCPKGLAAPGHVGSSWIRNQTCVSCIDRQIQVPQVLIFIISKTITALDQFSISFVTNDLKHSTLKQQKYTLTVPGARRQK